jgi:Leucine-rich repeat (LRR) protein
VWAKTGVIALRDVPGLTQLPDALWGAPAAAATACDLGGNRGLAALPPRFFMEAARLTRLRLTGTGVATLPPAIASLTRLETLMLDSARLEGPLPAALWALPALRRLSLANNPGLTSLSLCPPPPGAPPGAPPPTPAPPFPPALEVLDVSHCGLTDLPACLGPACPRLALVDARHNAIGPSIPPTLAHVPALRLDFNRISSLPPTFFDGPGAATALLSLHANPITAEALRATPGWAAYDGRRLAAANKRLAGRALATGGGTAFEEGADAVEWMTFGGGGGVG